MEITAKIELNKIQLSMSDQKLSKSEAKPLDRRQSSLKAPKGQQPPAREESQARSFADDMAVRAEIDRRMRDAEEKREVIEKEIEVYQKELNKEEKHINKKRRIVPKGKISFKDKKVKKEAEGSDNENAESDDGTEEITEEEIRAGMVEEFDRD